MPENRGPEELAELARQIRRRVRERVEAAVRNKEDTGARLEAAMDAVSRAMDEVGGRIDDALSRLDTFITEAGEPEKPEEPEPAQKPDTPAPAPRTVNGSENFWDLGAPKPRIYAKASYHTDSLTPSDVNAPDPEPEPGERIAQSERIVRGAETAKEEKIPAGNPGYQGSTGRVVNTAGGQRSVPQSAYATRSYRRNTPRPGAQTREADRIGTKKSPGATVVKTYRPEGSLIREITVRTWEADTEFYNRFLTDALRSRNTKFTGDLSARHTPVPYFSYVPQYAHMSLAQVNYYQYVRESVDHGLFPLCDFPYVLLYIYEILNLPDVIPPEEGARRLATVWIGYRASYPRLDGYLCEWLPDYCMIHGIALPDELAPILPEIVPKAQFKEFFLNRTSGGMLTRTVIETSSDYDYRTSRYYAENRDAYEQHIPAAVSAALGAEALEHRGIFTLERVYKMTRDSFCGAIVASSVKRRLDIEFVSFTRRADTRPLVTSLVKHSENRLRAVLGIKAKLGEGSLGEEDCRAIDAYFAPLLPTKEMRRQQREDAYMPADYLKNYEAEDTGFDPGAAAVLEAQSWANAARLTGEDYGTQTANPDEAGEAPRIEGEMTTDGEISAAPASLEEIPATEDTREDTTEEITETEEAGESSAESEDPDEALLKDGLAAAMRGGFRAFCRERGLYEGELADRINARFLDLVGDVALEVSPDGGFLFIEDYREDAEEWLR
ncbi:MAG: TerB N-terminal domain-containing protein [Clostridia bacterium]|nr:TerB N-terminal domain-containing protein [Clostridia bacterium]